MIKQITVPNNILLEEAARLLASGKDVVLTPKGYSMLPFIRGGEDSVTLRYIPEIKVGDIVLVRLPQLYVLHRVIDINRNRLILMGDGNIGTTEGCTKDDVLGTVVLIWKGGRVKKPSRGRVWRFLLPVRRYLLAIYRRLFLKRHEN